FAHLALSPHAVVLRLSGEVPDALAAFSLLARPEAVRTHLCIQVGGTRACFMSERERVVYGHASAREMYVPSPSGGVLRSCGGFLRLGCELRCDGEAAARLITGTRCDAVLVEVVCTNEPLSSCPCNMEIHAAHLMLSLAGMLDARDETLVAATVVIAPALPVV